LKGTSSYGIHLTRGSSLSLHGFTDVDWMGSVDDQKSLVDILFFLVPPLFHGNLGSNALLLDPLLKHSIKLWMMVLLRFFGYAIF
jgi:succinate dehydrogenase hydrophobic anchor subunit